MADVKVELELREPQGNSLCSGVGPCHVKEEPELCIKQEQDDFPFHIVIVKSEDDENISPGLHQRPTEENQEETNCADEEHTASSSDTDQSEQYSHEQSPSKRSYAMIPADSPVTDHRPFSCSECGKIFRYKSDLQRHIVVHTEERPHKCSLCQKDFKQIYKLNEHMKTHSEDEPFDCSFCERRFAVKSNFTRHLRELHHFCALCKISFMNISDLNEHLGSHADDGRPLEETEDLSATTKPQRGSECDEGSRLQTLDHTAGRSMHICSVCEKCFQHKYLLVRHMRTHTGEKPFRCSVCNKGFITKSYLKRHLKDHTGERPHICSVCEKSFPHRYKLYSHMKTHSGEKPFKCSFCDKCFTGKGSLKVHLRNHTGERPYICSVCEKGFNRNTDLSQHEGLVHHICPVCKKHCADRDKLRAHVNTHVNEGTLDQAFLKRVNVRPYSCSECERRCKSESDLQAHMLVHLGEKPHKCSVCDKSFTEKYTLKTHLMTHTKERPYICPVCHKGFNRKFTLTRHLRNHDSSPAREGSHGEVL